MRLLRGALGEGCFEIIKKWKDYDMTSICSMEVQNFKGIEHSTFLFDKGINLVIGDNGAGKSSLLGAIRGSLCDWVYLISGDFSKQVKKEEVRIRIKKLGDATYTAERFFPVLLRCDALLHDEEMHVLYRVQDERSLDSNIAGNINPNTIREKLKESSVGLPLLCYQSFDRDCGISPNLSKKTISIEVGTPTVKDGYLGCLEGKGNEGRIQQWCLKMALMEFEKKTEIKEFRTFQSIIGRFVNAIEDSERQLSVYYSSEHSGLVLDDTETTIPLYSMSTRYRAIMAMIMELAYRTVLTNPTIDPDLQALEGIVIIDEIDAHLHPKWQWRILGALREVFPKVQFIIATHSPIVIASAQDAKLIMLDGLGNVNYLENAYGYSANDVLALRQGSTGVSDVYQHFMNELEEALLLMPQVFSTATLDANVHLFHLL